MSLSAAWTCQDLITGRCTRHYSLLSCGQEQATGQPQVPTAIWQLFPWMLQPALTRAPLVGMGRWRLCRGPGWLPVTEAVSQACREPACSTPGTRSRRTRDEPGVREVRSGHRHPEPGLSPTVRGRKEAESQTCHLPSQCLNPGQCTQTTAFVGLLVTQEGGWSRNKREATPDQRERRRPVAAWGREASSYGVHVLAVRAGGLLGTPRDTGGCFPRSPCPQHRPEGSRVGAPR